MITDKLAVKRRYVYELSTLDADVLTRIYHCGSRPHFQNKNRVYASGKTLNSTSLTTLAASATTTSGRLA
jgi:hypothetical protein